MLCDVDDDIMLCFPENYCVFKNAGTIKSHFFKSANKHKRVAPNAHQYPPGNRTAQAGSKTVIISRSPSLSRSIVFIVFNALSLSHDSPTRRARSEVHRPAEENLVRRFRRRHPHRHPARPRRRLPAVSARARRWRHASCLPAAGPRQLPVPPADAVERLRLRVLLARLLLLRRALQFDAALRLRAEVCASYVLQSCSARPCSTFVTMAQPYIRV